MSDQSPARKHLPEAPDNSRRRRHRQKSGVERIVRPGDQLSGQTTPVLLIREDGSVFRTPGAPEAASLYKDGPSSRLLAVLAIQRADAPGVVMLPAELIAAVWPGEIIAPRAAKNRLHVALSALRKAGLAEIIQRVDGGYRLDPEIPILLV